MTVAVRNGEIFPFHNRLKLLSKSVLIEKVAHSDSFFHIFVRVNGGYASSRRAEFRVAEPVLLKAVEKLVIGHAYNGLVAYFKIFGSYGNTLVRDCFNFICKVLDVNYHSVAHNVYGSVAENAGGEKIEYKFALVVNNGVTGVISALITGNYVKIGREEVDHASLALVAPIDPYYGS